MREEHIHIAGIYNIIESMVITLRLRHDSNRDGWNLCVIIDLVSAEN